jgi:hypothetical protein
MQVVVLELLGMEQVEQLLMVAAQVVVAQVMEIPEVLTKVAVVVEQLAILVPTQLVAMAVLVLLFFRIHHLLQ